MDNSENWFVRFALDPSLRFISCGNLQGRTYVWDVDGPAEVGSSDDVPTVVTGLIAELSEFIDDVLPTANFDDEDNDGELKQATTPCPLPPRFPFPHSEQCPTFTFIFSSTPYRGNVS